MGGTTFAIFSDIDTSGEGQFMAGTFRLYAFRDMQDAVGGPMFYTTTAEGQPLPARWPTGSWAPGDEVTRILMVRNTGSLNGYLKRVGAEITGGDSSLAGKLRVRVTDRYGNNYVPPGTLAEFAAADRAFTTPLLIRPAVNLIGSPLTLTIRFRPGATITTLNRTG